MRHDPIGPNVAVLEQARALLATLSAGQYRLIEERLSTASIGAHLRHVLDHYRLFLEGLPSGVVDYDARERDTLVEHDLRAAGALIQRLIAGLRALPAEALARPVQVRQQGRYEAGRFDGCASHVERELLFLQSHAVHHFAMIAMLGRAQGLAIPREFGMAPSTVAWLAAQKSSATAAATATPTTTSAATATPAAKPAASPAANRPARSSAAGR